jgi:spore maturation protein CgeB
MKTPKVYDWCFVGVWNPRRQQYLEGLAKVSKNFVVYGPRWRRRTFRSPTLWLRVKGQGIWGKDLTCLYNQTKVAINISTWGDKNRETRGVNMRLLEVPACGTCLLTDFASDAQLLLTPEQEFVSAANLEEMQEKLAALLADDEKRSHIAQQGYEKASRVRTYDDMAAEISQDWAALQVPSRG